MERRRFVFTVAGTAGVTGLAGCLGGGDDGNGGDNGGNDTDNGDENGSDNGSENGDENGNENGDENDLDAAFEWSPEGPAVNERVTMDAGDSTGEIAEYRWDFSGDGEVDQTTAEATIQTAFADPGWRTVTLTVANSAGQTAETSQDIPVGVTQDLAAAFSWEPQAPSAGDVLVFSAAETTGSIVEYRWDLDGDGEFEETGAGTTLTYTIESAESFDVTLEVEAGNGETDSVTRTVEVVAQGEAAFTADPQEPTVDQVVTFDASASTVEAAEYRWDFDGEGEWDVTTSEPTVTHTYAETGNKLVSLQIETTDGDILTANASVFVRETEPGRQVQFNWEPPAPAAGEEVSFSAAAWTENVAEYRWDFDGDGTTDQTTTAPAVTYTFPEEGLTPVTLEVEDVEGQTGSKTREVDVGGEAEQGPEAMFMWEPGQPSAGQEITFDGSLTEGDVVEYRWDLDADGEFEETTTQPTVTRTYEDAGVREVALQVEDGQGRTDTHTAVLDIQPAEDEV